MLPNPMTLILPVGQTLKQQKSMETAENEVTMKSGNYFRDALQAPVEAVDVTAGVLSVV